MRAILGWALLAMASATRDLSAYTFEQYIAEFAKALPSVCFNAL
jgi:hypothetical protein